MLNGTPRGFSMTSTRCVGEMEVDEPWLGLWLPLNYQVDMGASQHRTPELGGILQAFSLQNSFLGWCFGLC